MKYILTETQEEYLKKWNKFQRFMVRRDAEIKELISKLSKRPLTNLHMVMSNVIAELANELEIDENDDRFDWIHIYLYDNYRDYGENEVYKNYKDSKKVNESVIDDIEDDKLVKIIDKLVRYVYGRELRMEENKDGYLRFFSSGPVAPYHRNLHGTIWMDDNRLAETIKGFFGTNWDETFALIAFYFSKKYDIKVRNARRPISANWATTKFDYSDFDDPNKVVSDEDENY